MNFDAQKFFMGIIDFFSIVLPGAVLVFLLNDWGYWKEGFGQQLDLNKSQDIAVFAFASYVSGHAIFLLGSWLDDLLYANIREYTRDKQIERMAQGKSILPRFWRVIVWLIFKDDRNQSLHHAKALKEARIGSHRKAAINTFQWAKSWLRLDAGSSLAVVERFEADSKFFRSFAVLLFLWLIGWIAHSVHEFSLSMLGWTLLLLFGMALSLWRYLEQRFKAINHAYGSVITLAASKDLLPKPSPRDQPVPKRVRCRVYRESKTGQRKYLLVAAEDEWDIWIPPGGPCEGKHSHREDAIRYVLEKAGAWTMIEKKHPSTTFRHKGKVEEAVTFCMKYGDKAGLVRRAYRCKWVTPKEWLVEGRKSRR